MVTLQINNIEENDSAQYLCEVVVGINNKITEKAELRVRTPVRLEDDSSSEVTVVEGQRASLDCITAGFPKPSVTWTRKDGRIMFNGKESFSGASLVYVYTGSLKYFIFHPIFMTGSQVWREQTGESMCVRPVTWWDQQ